MSKEKALPTRESIHAAVAESAKTCLVDTSKEPDFAAPMVNLGIDSLDVMTLSFELEEVFDIEIPDHAEDSFKTLQDVEDYLVKELCNVG